MRIPSLLIPWLLPVIVQASGRLPTAPVGDEANLGGIYRRGEHRRTEKPILLSRGPHVLVDDFFVAKASGVARRVVPPVRDPGIPNPILTGKEDGTFQPYVTVIRDGATGRFRMWYDAPTHGKRPGTCVLMTIESKDGIAWERPARALDIDSSINAGASVIDEGPAFEDPSARYKLTFYGEDAGGVRGMQIWKSPDGYQWEPFVPYTAISHNHDIENAFYDPLRKRYVAIMSVSTEGPTWTGKRRVTMESTSPDLLDWRKPWYILTPDDRVDSGETQFYAMNGHLVRGDLWIALVKILRDDIRASAVASDAGGVGYTTLAWSRDGEHWLRDTAPYFEPDPAPGAWDHAHAWIDFQLPVGDDVYLYYGGYKSGHKFNRYEERQIGLLKIRRDRYVAWEAGPIGGGFESPLVQIDGTGLSLNADIKGEIRVAVLDESGRPIDGLGSDDCVRLSGDSLDHEVQWKRPLAELRGRRVRLRFAMKDARLFAIDVH